MTDHPLVISTRAAPDHIGMADRLRAAGHEVVACPLQRRVAIDEALLASDFDALSPVKLMVVTSPQAAQVAVRALGAPRLRDIVLIAPGPGTAEVLQQCGLDVVFPVDGGTSEDVLSLAATMEPRVRGARAVILAAPGGRILIARTLSERGADVHVLAPYRREPVPVDPALLDALAHGRSTITLLSSSAALDALHDSLPDELRARWLEGRFIVSSPRLAQRLQQRGATRIRVADGASESALTEALSGSDT